MLPEFPIAQKNIKQSQLDYFQHVCGVHLGDFFGKIPQRVIPEGDQLRQEYSKEMFHESDMTTIESSYQLKIDQAKEDPYVIYEKLYEMAKDFADQKIAMMLKRIDEITVLTGNVSEIGEEFKTENFFDSLERVHMDFDAQGNPRFPTILAAPEIVSKMKSVLKAGEHLPENRKRFAELIEAKRKQWHDRENNRKLVD